MSNSQKKRAVKATGSTSRSPGRSSTTGPKVGKKPAPAARNREKALADARKAASGRNNQLTIWIVAAVVVAALVVAGILAVKNSNDEKERAASAVDLGAGTVENGAITWGEAAAPVTVEYWVDMLCPACRVFETQASETIEQAVKDGTVKLVVHPVAILDEQTQPAGYSSRAASAVLSAGGKEKGYLYMKKLYEQQPAEGSAGLTDDEIVALGEDVGLGDDWKKSVQDGEFKDTPATTTKEFADKGYTGTPTVTVNGQEFMGSPADLQTAIDEAKSK